MKRISDNAYKIELPGKYNVSGTFNVADLSPYYAEEEEDPEGVNDDNEGKADSRTNLSLAGEDDAPRGPIDPLCD